MAPGATNEALGTWLADQFKPQRLMILQQELADVVCDIQPDASQAVVALPTVKSSGCTFNTHELIGQIRRKYTTAWQDWFVRVSVPYATSRRASEAC